MTSVFLSYDRDDSAAARVIATALEAAGHEVWWDLHVRGGAQFSKVIEEALKAADAVAVLWSRNAIESAWVRDEASAGRDRGCLIPATLDGTQAPLGFRQFQTIDLADWKRGAKSRGYKEFEAAIAELGGHRVQTAPPPPEQTRQRFGLRTTALAALAILGVIGAGAYFFWPSPSAAVPTVTVLPASSTANSQALSRDLLAKLGVLQASNSDALQLVEEGSGNVPDLIFKVDASGDGPASKATLLLLSGKNRALLWSGDFEDPNNNPSDLKQQLAYSAANVLDCAADAYGSEARSLDEQTRHLYLNGCGMFTQITDVDLDNLVRIFREVIRRAPRFAPAWARLLTAEDEIIFTPPFDRRTPAALAQYSADVTAAQKVSPDLPQGYIGKADLITEDQYTPAMQLLDLAVEKNPNDAFALTARSNNLIQLGRLRDAVTDARRAQQLRPFSLRAQEAYISALTYSGQIDEAKQELAKAEALFPGATNIEQARYRLNLRYGSAEDALEHQPPGVQLFPSQEAFLKARINPTPANIGTAIEATRKRLDGSSTASGDYVQVVAAFGRSDGLVTFLLTLPSNYQTGFAGVLFRPAFHELWRDPRAMQVAARFRFLEYWQSSGHWPDFCSWPDLPYDCKKEAAKLSA